MNFFWKLYFSIMAITLTCFSVGGYMLIQTSFDNSFEREVEGVYQENDILVNSLTLELLPHLEELTIKGGTFIVSSSRCGSNSKVNELTKISFS